MHHANRRTTLSHKERERETVICCCFVCNDEVVILVGRWRYGNPMHRRGVPQAIRVVVARILHCVLRIIRPVLVLYGKAFALGRGYLVLLNGGKKLVLSRPPPQRNALKIFAAELYSGLNLVGMENLSVNS